MDTLQLLLAVLLPLPPPALTQFTKTGNPKTGKPFPPDEVKPENELLLMLSVPENPLEASMQDP